MLRRSLPAALIEQALAFQDGTRTPAEPKTAATVVLLRQGLERPEVYLLRRAKSMAFAAGMAVFPGGAVDPRDFDATVGWAGPSPAEWAAQLGVDEASARALVCAAVRETYEESGVLLAGPSADTVVADTSGADWESDRVALESHALSFTAFLAARSLVVRSDLLGAWSGWLTPEFEPRRYRTWFFVAVLPHGQVTRDVSTESTDVLWMEIGAAADQAAAGELKMMPPTYLTCREVGEFATTDAVLVEAAGRTVSMFTPSLTKIGDEMGLSMPVHLERYR